MSIRIVDRILTYLQARVCSECFCEGAKREDGVDGSADDTTVLVFGFFLCKFTANFIGD
jgi:hypothetical protein